MPQIANSCRCGAQSARRRLRAPPASLGAHAPGFDPETGLSGRFPL